MRNSFKLYVLFFAAVSLVTGSLACDRIDETKKAQDEAIKAIASTREIADELVKTVTTTKEEIEETQASARQKFADIKHYGERKIHRGVLIVRRYTPHSRDEANKMVIKHGQSLMTRVREWFASFQSKEGFVGRNHKK